LCDESAERIVDMLIDECHDAHATFELSCEVRKVKQSESRGSMASPLQRFHLDSTSGPFECNSLVIATGGLSIPKIGATGFGYKIAEQFGLNIVPPAPALVGLNFGS